MYKISIHCISQKAFLYKKISFVRLQINKKFEKLKKRIILYVLLFRFILQENETFGPSRKELRCDLKNYFFFIFRIANNKLIDILEVEKNEKKIRFRFLID